MDTIIGQELGQYRVTALLGKGGMATVYRAQQTSVKRDVAIKVIRPELVDTETFLARFEREAQLIASLSHPHILKVFDYGQQNGLLYLVMELLTGGSLADAIQPGALPVARVGQLLGQISAALDYAHRRDIVHRDLKPSNVLLDQDGNAILTDFGLARLISDEAHLTATGLAMGTPAYMPPEQWLGLDTDSRSDLYALGILLFEMLTGELPFPTTSTSALMKAHLNTTPPVERLAPELDALKPILLKAMAKNPEARFETANALAAAFSEALRWPYVGRSTPPAVDTAAQTFTPTRPLTPPPGDATTTARLPTDRLAKRPQRRWLGIGAAILVVGVIAAVLGGLSIANLSANRSANQGAATPTRVPLAQVAPVAADEYMVLVAQTEPLGTPPRAVTPFVLADLRQKLEVTVPYSKIRIREYPQVIASEADALAAAAANNAALIVWGNASADLIELHIQAGALHNPLIAEAIVRRSTDVTVHLTDPRQQSAAWPIVAALVTLQSAASNIDTIRSLIVVDELSKSGAAAEIVGTTTGAQLARLDQHYISDTLQALSDMQTVAAQDAGNPVLYLQRSQMYIILNQLDRAQQDLATARRLVEAAWPMTDYLESDIDVINGNFDQALTLTKSIIAAQPKDWFAKHLTGFLYYIKGDYANAKLYIDQAISLEPDANFPYLISVLLALRQGRINDGLHTIDLVFKRFPDPSFGIRFIQAAFGNTERVVYGPLFSAGGKLLIGQFDGVITDTHAGEKLAPTLADWYFMEGFAYCNQNKYAEAEASLSKGIALDPTFTLLYVIRAQVRQKQGKIVDALADVQAVNGAASPELRQMVSQGLNGSVSCQNILSAKPS